MIVLFTGLVTDGVSRMMAVQIPNRYNIQYLRTIPSDDNRPIYSVCWDGADVVAGSQDSILTFSTLCFGAYSYVSTQNIRGTIESIKKVGDYAFAIVHKKGDGREVRISSIKTLCDPKTTVCRFKQQDDYIQTLAVSDQYIAVCDVDSRVVNMWTTRGQFLIAFGEDMFLFPRCVLIL